MRIFKYLILYCVFSGCKSELKDSNIKFQLADSIEIKERFEYPESLFRNKDQLIHMFSQEHKQLYKLKDYIIHRDFDFQDYDYLISFGKEVTNLQTANDPCEYLTRTPIKAIYSTSEVNNKLYIYKIRDKNKYRSLCP